uniref:Secreted protein n=1 Tax=Heterorhabditis bacteriophora TaxID=37862 RepID=A0A1I7WV96_HETBA
MHTKNCFYWLCGLQFMFVFDFILIIIVLIVLNFLFDRIRPFVIVSTVRDSHELVVVHHFLLSPDRTLSVNVKSILKFMLKFYLF